MKPITDRQKEITEELVFLSSEYLELDGVFSPQQIRKMKGWERINLTANSIAYEAYRI